MMHGACPHDGMISREDCVRCLRESRDEWQGRAESAEADVKELDEELAHACLEAEREADKKWELLQAATVELVEAVEMFLLLGPGIAHTAQRMEIALDAAEEALR